MLKVCLDLYFRIPREAGVVHTSLNILTPANLPKSHCVVLLENWTGLSFKIVFEPLTGELFYHNLFI